MTLFITQRNYKISIGLPPAEAPNAVRKVKFAFFDWSRSLRLRRLTAENVCPPATVVHVHDGALAEEYAVSSALLI